MKMFSCIFKSCIFCIYISCVRLFRVVSTIISMLNLEKTKHENSGIVVELTRFYKVLRVLMHANRNHAGWEIKTSPVIRSKFWGKNIGNWILEITSKYICNICWATDESIGPGRHCGVAIIVFLCVIVCFISLKTPCDFCLHSLNSNSSIKARWKAKNKAKYRAKSVVCMRKCIKVLYVRTKNQNLHKIFQKVI